MTAASSGTGWHGISPDVRIVHFGSPEGTKFGSHEKQSIEEFKVAHPAFVIPGVDE